MRLSYYANKTSSLWNQSSKFQGIEYPSGETEVCQFTFRVANFPMDSREKQNTLGEDELTDIKLLYQLVYCVECSVPVYWGCLPDREKVQAISVNEREYFVFKCEVCYFKATGKDTPHCRECLNEGGYMKKVYSNEEKDLFFGFIHPVCALSFPNIYTIDNPVSMKIKLCTGVQSRDLEGEPDQSSNICDICNISTPRILKCHDFDKFEKKAHAYCLVNQNKELVY